MAADERRAIPGPVGVGRWGWGGGRPTRGISQGDPPSAFCLIATRTAPSRCRYWSCCRSRNSCSSRARESRPTCRLRAAAHATGITRMPRRRVGKSAHCRGHDQGARGEESGGRVRSTHGDAHGTRRRRVCTLASRAASIATGVIVKPSQSQQTHASRRFHSDGRANGWQMKSCGSRAHSPMLSCSRLRRAGLGSGFKLGPGPGSGSGLVPGLG
jgi:hypothetical protein